MSVKVGEIWDTVPGSGLCVSPRRSGPPRRYGPQTGVSLDLFTGKVVKMHQPRHRQNDIELVISEYFESFHFHCQQGSDQFISFNSIQFQFKLDSGFFNSIQFQFKSDSESFNSIPIQFIFFQFQFNSIQILCTVINKSIR